jgi:two-component system, NarL family, nitrate/nitrite response regulator NarL
MCHPSFVANPATVFLVEDDPYCADVVAQLLARWPEIHYVGCASTATGGLLECRACRPDIVILDLWLPDGDGYQIVEQLPEPGYQPRILLFTSRCDDVVLARLKLAGVWGLIWKGLGGADELRAALHALAHGRRYFSADVQEAAGTLRASADAYFKILSNRELSLIPFFATGASDGEVASAVGMSPATAHSHRHRIMVKLNLRRTVDLMQWAAHAGFVRPMAARRAAARQDDCKS